MIETKFKDSELGPIPEDWEVAPLCEFFLFGNGYTPSKEVESFWKGGTIPWFRMEDIREHGRILFDSIQHITPLGVKGKLFPSGSFILSTTATIGEHAWLIADSLANQQFTFLTKGKSLKPILSEFFFYKLYEIGDWCRSNVSTNTLMAVNIKELKEYPLSLPPTETEQKRIAEALSDVDALIKELDALIEKKRMVLKATMQDLLTARRRLPGFSEPWIVKTIDEICFRFDNLRIPVAEKMREKGSTPYYGANGIQGYVKGFTHNGEFILLAEDGANNLKDYPIQYVKGKIWVNNHAHVLSANENYATTRFLSFSLKCIDYEKAIVGGSRAKLNSSTLMLLNVYIPTSLSEQQAIAAILSDLDLEIAELEKKKEKYTSIRQGMMQQLLTGKIRLI